MSAPARLRRLAALLALAASVAFAQAPEPKLSPADWNAIRAVVADQRSAIVAGDARRAFAYASPGVRERFGNARTFLAMVRESYAPLAEGRDAQLLDGAVVEGRVVQPLQLVMPDETVLIAIYTMEQQRGGAWRISGCLIVPTALRVT